MGQDPTLHQHEQECSNCHHNEVVHFQVTTLIDYHTVETCVWVYAHYCFYSRRIDHP
jgi:hypothetical protein